MLRDLLCRLLRCQPTPTPPVETWEYRVIRNARDAGETWIGEAFFIDGEVRFVSDPVAFSHESAIGLRDLVDEAFDAFSKPEIHYRGDGDLTEVP